jgi:hypothetical protein
MISVKDSDVVFFGNGIIKKLNANNLFQDRLGFINGKGGTCISSVLFNSRVINGIRFNVDYLHYTDLDFILALIVNGCRHTEICNEILRCPEDHSVKSKQGAAERYSIIKKYRKVFVPGIFYYYYLYSSLMKSYSIRFHDNRR